MMQAALIHEHGGLDKIVFEAGWPDPVPQSGEVIIRVRACALNYHDVFTRKGMPGIRIGFPRILGNDLAGEIAVVGQEVSGWAIGDRVLVDPIDRVKGGLMGETRDGGLAQFCAVPAHQLVRIGQSVSFAEAAALPVAYGTAYRMIIERGKVRTGETVLILGASGGVGTCCVQLAKQAGATVIACASSDDKLDRLRALGADAGINYANQDFVAECHRLFGRARVFAGPGQGGVDVVVNFTGGDTWTRSLRVLRRDGRLLTCGATAGYNPPEDIRFIWTFELNIVGSNGWSRADVEALLALVQARRLVPALHPQRFRLDQAREAMALLDDRAVFGKIIVEP